MNRNNHLGEALRFIKMAYILTPPLDKTLNASDADSRLDYIKLACLNLIKEIEKDDPFWVPAVARVSETQGGKNNA